MNTPFVECSRVDYVRARYRIPPHWRDRAQPTLKDLSLASVKLIPVDARYWVYYRSHSEGKRVAGFWIAYSGELGGVFNATGIPGLGEQAVRYAVSLGAESLNCFAGFLERYYTRLGWVETGRSPFDPALAPQGWDAATMGMPDVVMFRAPRIPHRQLARHKQNLHWLTRSLMLPEPGRFEKLDIMMWTIEKQRIRAIKDAYPNLGEALKG